MTNPYASVRFRPAPPSSNHSKQTANSSSGSSCAGGASDGFQTDVRRPRWLVTTWKRTFGAKAPHTKVTLSVDSAHTKYMLEDKVPLCDRHHFRMRPEPSSFSPVAVFKCASQDCTRYYGRRYGYFDLLPNMAPFPEKIDPASRFMKVCTTRQTHSYMAITRPKNTASDAKNLWCWHCYECSKGK